MGKKAQQRPGIDVNAATSNLIGKALTAGVITSTVIIFIGLFLFVLTYPSITSVSLQGFPRTFATLVTGLRSLNPESVLTFGILILIVTPLVRVMVSIYSFIRYKDTYFSIITILVFIILLGSIYIPRLTIPVHVTSDQAAVYSGAQLFFIFMASLIAGIIGAIVGLGGGALIVPLLTLVFKFPIAIAIGASFVALIATSSGGAGTVMNDKIVNIRTAMFLEPATAIGAICGAVVSGFLPENMLSVIFGSILCMTIGVFIYQSRRNKEYTHPKSDRIAKALQLNSVYIDRKIGKDIQYSVTNSPIGLCIMYVAGVLSGILGIGSGAFKVLALDSAMKLPIKVSTATSIFMIGVTATASVGIYFTRGDILPLLAAPVALGSLTGSVIGSKSLEYLTNRTVKILFICVVLFAAIEMILHGIGIW